MRAGGANVRCVMEMQVSGLWLLRESEVTASSLCCVCAIEFRLSVCKWVKVKG